MRALFVCLLSIFLVTAAVTSSAAAFQTDPIFAAIEAHKAARGVVYTAVDAVAAIERKKEDPRLPIREAELLGAFDAETDAACVLVTVRPTTMAGVVALLQYANAADTDGEGWPDDLYADDTCTKSRSWHYFLIEALAEVLPGMVQA